MTWSQRDVPVAQPLGVDLDLQLLVAHAPDRDVRDAGDAHQARPHRPARDHGLLDRRDSSSEDSAIIITRLDDESGCSIVGGLETFGSACAWVSALLHELPRPVDVGPRLEHERDRRQARQGLASG